MFDWIMKLIRPTPKPKRGGISIASNVKASGDIIMEGITVNGDDVWGGKVKLSGKNITIDDITLRYRDDVNKSIKKLTDKGYRNVRVKKTRTVLKVEYTPS